ncbi:hypothetical protein D3C80_1233850 [compost metagenome]
MKPIILNRIGGAIVFTAFILLIFKGTAVFVGGENQMLETITSYVSLGMFIIGGLVMTEAYQRTK